MCTVNVYFLQANRFFFCLKKKKREDSLSTKLLLKNKEAAKQSKENDSDHKGKAQVGSRTVAASYDVADLRIQRLDELETLSHPLDDPVDVLAIPQGEP